MVKLNTWKNGVAYYVFFNRNTGRDYIDLSESKQKYIRSKGKDLFYDKDSIKWEVMALIPYTNAIYNKTTNLHYSVRSLSYKDKSNLDNDKITNKYYYSIINNNEDFLILPQNKYEITGGVYSLNTIYVSNSQYEIAIADTNLNILSPFMPFQELNCFALKNKKYLIIKTRQVRRSYPSPESAVFVSDTSKAVRKIET